MTRTFFPGCNNESIFSGHNWNGATMAIGTAQRMMARHLYLFSGRNWNGLTMDRRLYLFFPVVIGTAINW